jgi:hypothetical protein
MGKTKAAADLVLRYLIARAWFRGKPWEPPSNLEYQIGRGVRVLPGGVWINEIALKPTPAIIRDRQDPDFWAAVICGDDGAIDMDTAELAKWRNYVLNNVPVSEWRELIAACSATRDEVVARRLTLGWASGLSRWLPRWGKPSPSQVPPA